VVGLSARRPSPARIRLRNDGIEMIAPHRSNRRKPTTQDRRRLSRYMRRWLVERFFAGLCLKDKMETWTLVAHHCVASIDHETLLQDPGRLLFVGN
jgi:hypothetical protein